MKQDRRLSDHPVFITNTEDLMSSGDSDLIELGRQFEAVVTRLRRIEVAVKKTCAERDRLAQERGISVDDKSRWQEIKRESGHATAYGDLCQCTETAVRLMKAIHKAKATTLAGFSVKLAAVAFDQFDFEGNPQPTDVAEVQLLRLSREMSAHVRKAS